MDYKDVVEELLAIPRFKKKADLENITRLLRLLGNPQKGYQMIHVAGTNGKGSICAFLNQMLIDKEEKVGLFTSPHLVSFRERFQIDGKKISKEDFVMAYRVVKTAVERLYQTTKVDTSFFEYVTAMAFVYFKEKKVTIAIIEAGLGGRTDTTNVIEPVLSVIASIGLDHMAILGDTLEKIAYEKAGIMKPNVPVVVSAATDGVRLLLEKHAKNMGIPYIYAGSYEIERISNENLTDGIDFSLQYEYDKRAYGHLATNALYQLQNVVTAVIAFHTLYSAVSIERVMNSVAKVHWPGRMEEIEEGIIVDGAHNPQAIEEFCKNLDVFYKDTKKSLLFAVSNDKDEDKMIQQLSTIPFSKVYVTELQSARKTDSGIEKAVWDECRYQNVEAISDLNLAVAKARAEREKDEILFCVGSLYLVGSMKSIIGGQVDD